MITEKIKYSGKLIKTHGIKGDLVLSSEQALDDELFNTELVFLMIEGLPVPFFIYDLNERSENIAVLKIEGYETPEEASKLIGCEVFIPFKKNKRKSKLSTGENDLEGYKVIDQIMGEIGTVHDIIDYKKNLVIQVFSFKNKEILIPANDNIIREINDKEKTIKIVAPDGLIQLYL